MKKVTFLCFVSGFLLFAPLSLSADIASFVFTTDPQTIPADTLSGPLTIASRNLVGQAESLAETTDLVFTSTSPTGLFLNSAGTAVSTTMSKGTGNRTFYYRDPSVGSFVLSIKATGRTSQKSFVVTQTINVEVSGNKPLGNTSSSTFASTSGNTSGGSVTSTGTSTADSVSLTTDLTDLSSTAASVAVDNETPDPGFRISIGRDRLSSVGSDIDFEAHPSNLSGISSQAISYVWNFGDGSLTQGRTVSHAYRFPGDYEVVVNAGLRDVVFGNTLANTLAVSRLTVHVIAPDILISKIPGAIKLSNHSSAEINVGEWTLQTGIGRFTFPLDTIVPVGKSTVIPQEISGLFDGLLNRDGEIDLRNPLNKVIAAFIVPTSTALTPVTIVSTIGTTTVPLGGAIAATTTIKILAMSATPAISAPSVFPVLSIAVGTTTSSVIKNKNIKDIKISPQTEADRLDLPISDVISNSDQKTQPSFLDTVLLLPKQGWVWAQGIFAAFSKSL